MNHDAFRSLPIFHGFNDQQRSELLALTHAVEVNAGEQIITQGKRVQNLWFIVEGRCEVTRRTESGCQLKLAELEPFAQFGEMSFFHSAPHSADVVALTPMKLLRLGREDYDKLCDDRNVVAYKLALNAVEQLAERLRKTDQWITELVCQEGHKPTASEWTTFREICFRGA